MTRAVAIGNPLSLESTVSNGIVSGIRTADKLGGKFLQITAPISPGSSGGPLFNMAGEVVGITTMGLKSGGNLNFAIPINDAKHMLLAKSSKMSGLPNEPEPKAEPESDTEGDSIAEEPKIMAIIGRYCGDDDYKVWDSAHPHGLSGGGTYYSGHSGIVTSVDRNGTVHAMAAHDKVVGPDNKFQPGSTDHTVVFRRYTGDQ